MSFPNRRTGASGAQGRRAQRRDGLSPRGPSLPWTGSRAARPPSVGFAWNVLGAELLAEDSSEDCICGWSQGGFYIGGDFRNVLVEKLRFTVRGEEEKSISGRGNSFSKKRRGKEERS